MTMTRSAAVSRRAIEPDPGPGLRTAAHSCAPAQPSAASGQAAPPPPLPASANPAPRSPHPSPSSQGELLVFLKRLQVDIPSDERLDAMCKEIDEDENGVIDYNELCGLIRNLGVARTIDVAQVVDSSGAWSVRVCGPPAGEPRLRPRPQTAPHPHPGAAQSTNSFRATLRAYLNERKSLVLWKDVFDRVDGFPRNGQIDSFELRQVRAGEGLGQGQGAGLESLELPRARACIPAAEPSRERCPLRLWQAFDQMADMSNLDVSVGSFTDVLSERITVLMAKYDTDGDGQISFDEFKAKATDMVRPPRAKRTAPSALLARPPQRQP